jgi:putative hydrolase of the HAD superfamily
LQARGDKPGLLGGVGAVVFDFYGTLTPSTPAAVWLEHVRLVAAAMGVDGGALGAALRASAAERFTGALGGLPETLRALAGRLGAELSDLQLAEACRVRRTVQRKLLALRPEALPTISWLRERGLKIGVLSDCTVELPEAWPGLPVSALVDAAVFSCEVGLRKPDARLFALVTDRLGVSPANCLYVGDGGGHELSGARSAGLRPVMLAGRDWHQGDVHDREDDWDGPRIGSLADLRR